MDTKTINIIKKAIIIAGAASAIGMAIYMLKKRQDKKKLDRIIKEAQQQITTGNPNGSSQIHVKNNGLISSYDTGSFTVNGKTYTLKKNGIIKLQRYFSEKDQEAKKMIETSGGFDGKIGNAFIYCLEKILVKMPQVKLLTQTYIKSIFQLAKLNTNEYTVK